MRAKLFALVLAGALALCGCRENVYSGVSEDDANEMVSALLRRGIDAQKVSEGKGAFSVKVEHEDLVRSVDILKENSLPRATYQSLGTVFTGQAMISSQLEEQARLAYALSEELSATFARIDGVLDAVVYEMNGKITAEVYADGDVFPSRDALWAEIDRMNRTLAAHEQSSGITTPPSAAVFLRHTPDSPAVRMESDIRQTASRAVPGLTPDRVSVMYEEFREKVIPPAVHKAKWYERPYAIGLLSALAALIAALAAALALARMGIISVRRRGGGGKQ